MTNDLRKQFDHWIVSKFETMPDVRDMLMNHERKNAVLETMATQIRLFELGNWKDHNRAVMYRKLIVETVADMFSRTALEYAEQQALSDLEKSRLRSEATRIEDLKEQFAEMQKDATTDVVRVFQGA
jgi:hypothetical protein